MPMPDHLDALLPHLKFGTGQPVSRKEDPKLVTGRGRFTDDIALPGQVFAHPLRSHSAHGIIRDLDVGQALAAPGVLAVYTAADMVGYGLLRCKLPLKSADGSALFVPPRPFWPTGGSAMSGRSWRSWSPRPDTRHRRQPSTSMSTSIRCRW
jgi:carbon-monoxide dehydrogenase large subunit